MNRTIIEDMARELEGVNVSECAVEDGTPRFEFMLAANKEYRRRGGIVPPEADVSAIARAVIKAKFGAK